MISPFGQKMEVKKSLTNYKYLVIAQANQNNSIIYTVKIISILAKFEIKHKKELTISILHVNK